MAVQFAPQNNRSSIGSEIGAGLSQLIESKVANLKKAQGIKEREGIYKEAKLPSWLAKIEDPKERAMLHKETNLGASYEDEQQRGYEAQGLPPWLDSLPEQERAKFIEEFQKLSDEDKQKVSKALNNIGAEQYGSDDPEDENGELSEEEQMAQQPNGMQAPNGAEAPVEDRGDQKLSGLNSLMQAGKGFIPNYGQSNEVQSFPAISHGTKGAAPSAASAQPYANDAGLNRSRGLQKNPGKTGSTPEDALLKNQPKIQNLNASFTKQLDKEIPITEQVVNLSKELLSMEEAGETPENFVTRGYASYAPQFLNAYNKYNATANKIAALESIGTGKPSVFMTQLMQSTKPNTGQDKKERISLINNLIDKGEPILELGLARDEVIAEHGGLQPLNLKHLAKDRAIENKLATIDPSDYKDKTVIELFDKKFIKRNGEFAPLGRK